jgi:soluble lytic murein transglycosylase-like protein
MKRWPLILLLLVFPGFALAQADPAVAEHFVRQYAAHYHVSPELIAALIDVESRWDPQSGFRQGRDGTHATDARDSAAIWRL